MVLKDFFEVEKMIENRRKEAYRKINEEMISLYWDIGKYLSEKIHENKWGSKVIENLALFIKEKYPTLKGFNRPGLYRMVQFYEAYKDNEIVSPLVRQISWSNNLLILSGAKSIEEKEFYIRMCIKENKTTVAEYRTKLIDSELLKKKLKELSMMVENIEV